MRILHTSDLHGSETLYEQLEACIAKYRPHVLVLGGDMLRDGEPPDRAARQREEFENVLAPRIQRWRHFHTELQVLLQMGNHDWLATEAAALARAAADGWHAVTTGSMVTVHGVSFFGISHVPPTPHDAKDFELRDTPHDPPADGVGYLSDPATGALREVRCVKYFTSAPTLDELLTRYPIPASPWILLAHAPPYDTQLDRLPNIDFPVGSKAVRAFIEKHQPTCALHGHIHESPDLTGKISDTIAGVTCVNVGQSRDTLRAVVLDASDPAGTLMRAEPA